MYRFIRLVLFTSLVAGNGLPIARSHEHGLNAQPAGEQKSSTPAGQDPWRAILSHSSLTVGDRMLIKELRPWLDPEDYRALDPRRRKQLLLYASNRLHGAQPLARCWAPDTPESLLFAFHSVEEAAIARRQTRKANQFFKRWSRTANDGAGQSVQGQPITLSWSIVPDGTPIEGNPAIGDSDDPSSLRARLAEIYGGDDGPPAQQPWFPILQELFDTIGAQIGISYRYEPNDDGRPLDAINRGKRGVRGDLRIGGHAIDGSGDTLAYNYFPDHGDMIIDTSDDWFENVSENSLRLVNTLAHEHGHGLGLEHVCPVDNTKLLEPLINTGFRGMQFDEIYTLQRWYGDAFERHGEARDNDSLARACELEVLPGSPFSLQWLSIDDNADIDYFCFPVAAGSQLSARIIPSEAVYLEGPEGGQGCSAGAIFDSSNRHNLALQLVDQAGQVLATSDAAPAGEPEEFTRITIPGGGKHFLKITGDETDAAQLYRLEIDLMEPAAMIEAHRVVIVNESYAPANGRIEPGETVELGIELTNVGGVPGENVRATLSAPDMPDRITGFTTTREYGRLPPQEVVGRSFILAVHGECGDILSLRLAVEAENGFSRLIPVEMALGEITVLLEEQFGDSGGSPLPPGWASGVTGSGTGWTRSDAGNLSVRAETPPALGTSFLTSPAVNIGSEDTVVRFKHYLDTEASESNAEAGFDGGVLEVSRDGGAWEDIEDAGGRFTEGPYNRILSEAYQNPLPGRRAWSGSLGWVTSVVRLPAGLASSDLRFRWILGHDTSEAEEGWYLDDISVSSASCAGTRPIVRMDLINGEASEFLPQGLAQLNFSTPLPSGTDLTLPLLTAGSATPGEDTRSLDQVVLPAGTSRLELTFRPIRDRKAEGMEILEISLDPSLVVPQGISVAVVTIADTPYGAWAHPRLGPGPASSPDSDFDLDGWLNLEEYAWQSDPASPQSRPVPGIRRAGNFLYLDFPRDSLPPFLSVRVETSDDLKTWTDQQAESLPDGFRLPLNGPQGFVRLSYEEVFPP